MNTTREAALEAALKLARNRLQACAIDYPTGSREMAERSEWADEATAALATPATEPQGYVGGLAGQDINDAICDALGDAMYCTRVWDAWHYGTMSDEDFVLVRDDAARVEEIVTTINTALAARPAPQPAADTRGVVKPLVWECVGWSSGDGVKGENDDTWEAEVPTNDAPYCIEWFGGGVFHVNPPVGKVIVASSLAGAKAAAQADYEARILSALHPASPLGAVVMREKAANAAKRYRDMCGECNWPEEAVIVGGNVANDITQSIRALPLPTDDELLAAAAELPEVRALVMGAQWARNRLDIIADESWRGDGRDLKRSIIGIFADFDEALAPFTRKGE